MKPIQEFHNEYYHTNNNDLLDADQINELSYQQLRDILKRHPFDNFNQVKLNSKAVVLRSELAEIMDEVEKQRHEFTEFLQLIEQYKDCRWDILYSANGDSDDPNNLMLTLNTLTVEIRETEHTCLVSLYCVISGNHPSNSHGELEWFSIDTLYEHWREMRTVIRTNYKNTSEIETQESEFQIRRTPSFFTQDEPFTVIDNRQPQQLSDVQTPPNAASVLIVPVFAIAFVSACVMAVIWGLIRIVKPALVRSIRNDKRLRHSQRRFLGDIATAIS